MNDYNSKTAKLKRVLAFLFDYIFILLIVVVVLIAVVITLGLVGSISTISETNIIVHILGLAPYLLILRDFIFGGTSLGKRILKLSVMDYDTGGKPKLYKTILRQILFFILPIEIIYLLLEGRTLGDRIAHTVVVSKLPHKLNPHDIAEASDETNNIKNTLIKSGIIFFVAVAFLGMLAFGWYSTLN